MELFLISLFPAVPILAAPRRWARAAAGWVLLGIGLMLIAVKSDTAQPFDDDGAGSALGVAIVAISTLSIVLALLIRHRALIEGPGDEDRSVVTRWLCDWAIPLGFLVAAAFLHWLSNRIAGASPAALIHILLVAGGCATAAAVLWRAGWRFGALRPAGRFGFALPAAFAAVVVWDAVAGFDMWARVQRFADGEPWCAMTYGGFEHERQARSGWDLSPLVNRRYGHWGGRQGALPYRRQRI
ncbi:MAG TPA: hypothetical protein VGB08_03400 [Allosphingosinicella sp.]|jgi:hypothetical protein